MLGSEVLQMGCCLRTNFQLPDFFFLLLFSHHCYDFTHSIAWEFQSVFWGKGWFFS